MQNNSFEYEYRERLKSLADDKKITQTQLDHFIRRGIQSISPTDDFDLESLGKMLPRIVIGASDDYINRMKVPYQATSYIAANTKLLTIRTFTKFQVRMLEAYCNCLEVRENPVTMLLLLLIEY
jgi:hypothetical protein